MGRPRIWPKAAVVGLLALPILLVMIAGRKSLRNDPHWLYIEQIVTGNWSSTQPADISDFVLGLAAAIVVNFGPLIAIFGAFLALVKRKSDMYLVNALASLDLAIEAAIVRNVLSDEFHRARAKR